MRRGLIARSTIELPDAALEARLVAKEIDARRLAITRATIADGMIMYPPLVRFPAVEDAGWSALHRALLGELDAAAALDAMQAVATATLGS